MEEKMEKEKQTGSPGSFEGSQFGERQGRPMGEQPAGEWAGSQARGLVSTARAGVEQATEYVQGAIEQTRGKMAEYRDEGFARLKDDVISYTREQPMTALLIAAGTGLLIGWLTTMTRR